MRKSITIFTIGIIILFLVGTAFVINKVTEKEQDLTFQVLNETPNYSIGIKAGNLNLSRQIIINKEYCWEVTCNCAKNTSTPCMAYCFECKDEVLEGLK
jgi:hypothetical protein